MTDFKIDIDSKCGNLVELFEIIKKKQFKSLNFSYYQYNNKYPEEFIEKLGLKFHFGLRWNL